ncbi:MAG TPA: hypothetical protein VIT38_15205 [Allosphingosinicella sp.]
MKFEVIGSPQQTLTLALERYLRRAGKPAIHLLVSPCSSPLLAALLDASDAMRERGCRLNVVLKPSALRDQPLLAGLLAALPADWPAQHLRICRFVGVRDLVDQLSFGTEVWRPGAKDAAIFKPGEGAAAAAAARRSFQLVFAMSEPPRLRDLPRPRPSASRVAALWRWK